MTKPKCSYTNGCKISPPCQNDCEAMNLKAEPLTPREEIIKHLEQIGVIPNEAYAHRAGNVGVSNYSQHVIQPWAIWLEWDLDAWEADIVKRTLRTKADGRPLAEARIEDYEKIKHICDEKIAQVRVGLDRKYSQDRSFFGARLTDGSETSLSRSEKWPEDPNADPF